MKRISIQINWPLEIIATDSDGQSVSIKRFGDNRPDSQLSDTDICQVVSRLYGDSRDQRGYCSWGAAFTVIQDLLNCSSLDKGWNHKQTLVA